MRQTTPTLATEPAQKARERKGHGQGHPWRQWRKAPSSSPKPTAPPQATAHKHRGDPEDSTDYGERIKNLEAIRRSARKAGEHAVAKQLTLQIADLRRENASARPIHEKIASAEAKLALAQHEAARAAELVAKACGRIGTADKVSRTPLPPPPTSANRKKRNAPTDQDGTSRSTCWIISTSSSVNSEEADSDDDMAQEETSATEEQATHDSSSEADGGHTTPTAVARSRRTLTQAPHQGGNGQHAVRYAMTNPPSEGDAPATQGIIIKQHADAGRGRRSASRTGAPC